MDPNDLLLPSDAARILRVSSDTVRNLANSGRLPVMRTVSGRRFFRREDVDRVAVERKGLRHGPNAVVSDDGDLSVG